MLVLASLAAAAGQTKQQVGGQVRERPATPFPSTPLLLGYHKTSPTVWVNLFTSIEAIETIPQLRLPAQLLEIVTSCHLRPSSFCVIFLLARKKVFSVHNDVQKIILGDFFCILF